MESDTERDKNGGSVREKQTESKRGKQGGKNRGSRNVVKH